MTDTTKPLDEKRQRKSRWGRYALAAVVLLLLLFLIQRCDSSDSAARGNRQSSLDSLRMADSLARLDSIRLAHSRDSLLALRSLLADSLHRLDSLARLDSLRRAHRKIDTARLRLLSDSLARARWIADSLARLDAWRRDSLDRARRAMRDTTPPHVFADPAAGVHPATIDVAVLSEEGSATPLCGPDTVHLAPCRDMIRVADHLVLWISARDTLGNQTRPERLEYKIDPNSSRCGPRRALVPTDSVEICVDAYEYPNTPALSPRTSVNWDEAQALCAKDGKRLCTSDELTSACKGPQDWTYPYGDRYVPGHCQDFEGTLSRGVAKPACRSWWGAFHLVGNAWEWSTTPGGRTYLAVGGTYTGGSEDKCGRTTRSFFKQNRYDAVGFRCCETLPAKN